MIFCISPTEIGSIPANGSSNKIKEGVKDNARAISTRRRSPPDKLIPNACAYALIQILPKEL